MKISIPSFRSLVPFLGRQEATDSIQSRNYRSTTAQRSTYKGRGGEYRRLTPKIDIERARDIYELESYGFEIVENVVDFAMGEHGPKVKFDSEARQMLWKSWAWNAHNPKDRPNDLARLGVLRLIRDGQPLDLKQLMPDGQPALRMLNPIWLSGNRGAYGYAGVEIDEAGRPARYHYYPFRLGLIDHRPRTFRADQIIHVFKTEWEDQLLGETWLKRSLVPLEMLDATDVMMVESVQRAARIPLLYKIPIELAYEYVRALDAQGNPINPDETIDQQQQAAAKILQRTMLRSPTEEGVITDETSIEKTPFGAVVSDPARMILLQRISRGLGLSVPALLGDHGKGGYLSSRFAVVQDEKFYANVQSYAETYLHAVIEFWMRITTNRDISLLTESEEYTIDMPVFPMANLHQDVQAMQGLNKMGLSVPTILERYGFDPDREARQQAEWNAKIGGDSSGGNGNGGQRTRR